MPRLRNRQGVAVSTTFQVGVSTSTSLFVPYTEECIDENTSPGVDHAFLLKKLNRDSGGIRMTKTKGTPGTSGYRNGNNAIPNNLSSAMAYGHVSLPTVDRTAVAVKLMADTNPSRPHVSIPVFVAELGDVASLVRLAGRTILGKVASANLSWQFGWKPLISDLTSMAQFSIIAEKRFEELRNLRRNGGLHRKRQFGSDSASTTTPLVAINSTSQFSAHASRTDQTQRRVWASCRWKPSHSFESMTDQRAQARLVYKLVLGLHRSQITSNIWEGLPWSWLIDWFTTTGDFIQATNNSVASIAGDPCVMEQTTTVRRFTTVSGDALVAGLVGSCVAVEKRRTVVYHPAITATFPLFTGRQLSILGSLTVLRSRFR